MKSPSNLQAGHRHWRCPALGLLFTWQGPEGPAPRASLRIHMCSGVLQPSHSLMTPPLIKSVSLKQELSIEDFLLSSLVEGLQDGWVFMGHGDKQLHGPPVISLGIQTSISF